ncbi:MAG: class I SAM-dependent methyltransferase [Candidatus Omnitrophota bacterium]|nr:class I SAM-dependent methyltransferase [Candidatus Omnitrophota bacterium]
MTSQTADARYQLKPGPLSSHGRILSLAWAWPRSSRILEIGTASGYLGRELRRRGFEDLTGVEQDPELAREAQPSYRRCYVADVEQQGPWPWEDGEVFDVLICADVLEHLRHPLTSLRRLTQLVRPGGQVIVSLPNAVNWTVRLMVACGRFDYATKGLLDDAHLRFFTHASGRRLLEEAGLRIQRTLVTPLPFTSVLEGRLPRWLLAGTESLYHGLSVVWKTMFAYQFIWVTQR